jgi:hypothetical protein
MKFSLKILILLIVIAMACPAFAEKSARFRLGKILAAEITRNNVRVNNLNKHAFTFDFRQKAFAVVTVKLDPGRSLSIYDFSLKLLGRKYACVALRAGHADFNGGTRVIKKSSPDDLYSMLFIVNAAPLGSEERILEGTLLYNLSKKGVYEFTVPFKYLGYSSLTSTTNIPASGMLDIKEKASSAKK